MSPPDVITLDNLNDALPQWSPENEHSLFAVVDMGSNGIRFSITSLAPSRSRLLTPIYSSRAGISLFDALTPLENGDLGFPEATIQAVSSALAQFNHVAELHDVPKSNIMVFATEAMRRAANSAVMLKAISEATNGLRVQILEPAVETLFGAVMGSRSGLTDVSGGALFLDLGGGSVQMTWVDTSLPDYEIQAARAGKSMPYGAAKLTKILQQGGPDVAATETQTLTSSMKEVFDNLCNTFPKLQRIRQSYERGEGATVDVYMCGGGCRGYGSMLMHNDRTSPYPIPAIGSYTVDGTAFSNVLEMRRINDTYNGKIFGLSRRRRQQFDAISTVMESFIATVPNVRRVIFCRGSNRDGALMMKLPREIREQNPLEVLANVDAKDQPLFDAVARLLRKAIPAPVELDQTPTVLATGLQSLFIQQIWSRSGHEADANASFALHNAISRDTDVPGLTHLARAVLGLTVAARWGSGMGPADAQLGEALRGILKRYTKEAIFWAQYIGAVANILAKVSPAPPNDVAAFESSISFDAQLSQMQDKKDHIQLCVRIDPKILQSIDPDAVVAQFESTMKYGDKKLLKKVAINVVAL